MMQAFNYDEHEVIAFQQSNSHLVMTKNKQQQPQPPFYGHYTRRPALAGTSSWEREDIVGAKFYCPHALADGNQCIVIRKKTLEFSLTVLSTLSPYHKYKNKYSIISNKI